MYKLIRLRRRRINSVPLGPKLHTTTSTPLVSKYHDQSSEMVPQWGTIFFSLTAILISTKSFFIIVYPLP